MCLNLSLCWILGSFLTWFSEPKHDLKCSTETEEEGGLCDFGQAIDCNELCLLTVLLTGYVHNVSV